MPDSLQIWCIFASSRRFTQHLFFILSFLSMKKTLFLLLMTAIITTGCFRKLGCTSESAFNFDPSAKEDNGVCEFAADGFAGEYTSTESRYHISASSTDLTYKNDSFIIFWVDTNRVQLRGFFDCSNPQDSINCIVRKYEAFLSGINPCSNSWQDFKMSREGDSVINYTYLKNYISLEKDSIIGRARKK